MTHSGTNTGEPEGVPKDWQDAFLQRPAKPANAPSEAVDWDQQVRRLSKPPQHALADFDAAEKRLAASKALAALGSQMGDRYSEYDSRLDRYEVYHPGQESALRRIRSLSSEEKPRNLVLYGSLGTGKDHLMTGLLWLSAAHGVYCRWLRGLDLYGELRDRIDAGKREEELLQQLQAPKVLAISDPIPPLGELSAWRLEFMARLIDRRYSDRKAVWVTVNAGNVGDVERQLTAPVWDRLQQDAEIIPCFWPSYRERKTQPKGKP